MPTNVALNKPVTAGGYILPFAPSRAVDGNTSPLNRWLCNISPTSSPWLQVDLGSVIWINRWVVYMMGSIGWPANYSMPTLQLQVSQDGIKWGIADTVSGSTAASIDRNFTPIAARYVKVNTSSMQVSGNSSGLASIVELQIYDAQPTSSYLSGLSVSSGTISPVFAPTTYSYTDNVGYTTSSITLTPTAQDPNASIMVGTTSVKSGQPSPAINLNVGDNNITVVVTSAVGGVKSTYIVKVTRAAASNNANLSNLAVNQGTLQPAFSAGVKAYTDNVGNQVSSITVTPTAADAGAVIKVNNTQVASGSASAPINLNVGANTITVDVTAQDGVTKNSYTLTVTRAAAVCLTNLIVTSDGTCSPLSPAFQSNTYTYAVTVDSSDSNVLKVTATDSDPTFIIKVNSKSATSGVTVSLGLTPKVQVTVTSGGTTVTYTVNVTIQ